MAGYTLDNNDLQTLQNQNNAAIAAARKSDEVDDEQMAHLYALKGKLARLIANRDSDEPVETAKPARTRTTTKKSDAAE